MDIGKDRGVVCMDLLIVCNISAFHGLGLNGIVFLSSWTK